MKRRIVQIVTCTMFIAFLCGCTVSAEDMLQKSHENIATGNYEDAEIMLLDTLAKEPDNQEVKKTLGELYRAQALETVGYEEIKSCFNKAKQYVEDFSYTEAELAYMASSVVEEKNPNAQEVLELVNDEVSKNENLVFDMELHVSLYALAVESCEDDKVRETILEDWLEKYPMNTSALCAKALYSVNLDALECEHISGYEDMKEFADKNGGKYAQRLYWIDDDVRVPQFKGEYVFDEKHQLIAAHNGVSIPSVIRESFSDDVLMGDFQFIYEEGKIVKIDHSASEDFEIFYDENNNPIKVKNGENTCAIFEYDEKGRIVYEEHSKFKDKWTKYAYNEETGKVDVKAHYFDYESGSYAEYDYETEYLWSGWEFFKPQKQKVGNGETIILNQNVDILVFDNGCEFFFPMEKGVTFTVNYEKVGTVSENAIYDYNAGMRYDLTYENINVELIFDEYGLPTTLKYVDGDVVQLNYMHTVEVDDGRAICRIPIQLYDDPSDKFSRYEVEYSYYKKVGMCDTKSYEYLYGVVFAPTIEVYYFVK